MTTGRPLLARSVLSDETYAVVRELVLEHELAPGQRLNIDALALRLGVSPTPVREALARLESDGLVVKVPLRGYTTTSLLTPKEFVELSQFRVVIEQWTAEEAATTASARAADVLHDELGAVRDAVAGLGSGPSALRALTEHDARFHGLIAELAGNELVSQSFERTHFHLHFLRLYLAARAPDNVRKVAGPTTRQLGRIMFDWERADQITWTIDQHAAIAEAVIAGDGTRAAALMREHIESSRRRTLPIVEALAEG